MWPNYRNLFPHSSESSKSMIKLLAEEFLFIDCI